MTSTDAPAEPFLDLYGESFLTDPHGTLAGLREQGWHAGTSIGTAVLRYDEVQALLGNRALRTPGADFLAMQGITDGPLIDTMRGFLLNTDGEPHHRVRRLVSAAFTVRRVEGYRGILRAVATELVDELSGRDECDFVEAFADPFALRALCGFVGIPVEVQEGVRAWTADVGLLFGFSVAEHSARIESALDNLHTVIDELVAERRRAPGDDLLSALVVAGETGELLSDAELRSMVITLMSAGHGTVLHQVGNAMATFLDHPDQWRLLAAGDPTLAAQTAEEVVRYSPSSLLGLPRIAKADIELNGVLFPTGSCVLPITGSANRDPRAFDNPDEFDITVRRKAHLTFGGGIHYCLGAALGRAQLQEALPLLASRLHDPEPAGPARWLPPTEAVYGPLSLPIRYRAS